MADKSLPLSTRSRRAIAAGVMGLAVVGVLTMGWRYVRALEVRDAQMAQMRRDLQQDRASGYRHMLELEGQMAASSGKSLESQSLAAYAATILALEHHQGDFARHARHLLAEVAQWAQARPEDAEAHAELRRAATALMAWGDGDADQSRSQVEILRAQDHPTPYELVELLRLETSVGAAESMIEADAQALLARLALEGRGWGFLAWRAIEHGDHAKAQLYLDKLLEISPEHERALLGKMWLTLGSLRCQKNTEVLLATAKSVDSFLDRESLSPPERSMALAVRARAQHLSGEAAASEKDLAEAKKLDPANPLLKCEDVLPPAKPEL